MMTEEIVLTLHSVKCPLKRGERATADDWHDAHRPGNKQTGIDIECFLTCLLHNVRDMNTYIQAITSLNHLGVCLSLSRVARPYSTPRERVWDMTTEQLVAQEFNYSGKSSHDIAWQSCK